MAKTSTARVSLKDRLATKPAAPAPLPDAVPAAAPVAASPAPAAGKGEERVQIIVRMTPAERKALRQIALDQDTTAQALAEEAIRDVLRRHGHGG
ncbi:ribbon-helix-helix domain-containing protein [Methylobacterium sp. MA0201]|uniref:ribbon-helix-helix domain-containing protein n=1 Tax=Methylobacterium alsaeris TaxID=3344826 RepID=UPI003757AF83